jgi:heme oxygenase
MTTQALSPANIMARLKNETTSAHKQLEKVPCVQRLFASDYQLIEYSGLLSRFYGYFAAIEPLLFVGLPTEYSACLQYRTKTGLLKQDLAVLDIDASKLPLCTQLPELGAFSQKMGAFYVLEGSTLGGQVISRHLSGQLGDDIAQALHFYQSYGKNVHAEWQGFAMLMSRCFENPEDRAADEVVATANQTFASLQQWLLEAPAEVV